MSTRAAESSSSEAAAVIDEAFVDSALDAAGFGCFQLVAIPACGLAAMSQSLQTNLLSYLQPCAGAAFGVPAQASAILASANFATSCVSTPVLGILADVQGRKWTTMVAVVVMALAGCLSACAPSFGALCAAQVGAGIGMGGAMVPFDLLAELSPPAIRGAVVNVSAWFWAAGTMLVILSAWLVLDAPLSLGGEPSGAVAPWRLLVLAVNLPVLLAAAALPWLPESPYWLVSQGRRASARRVLARMAELNGVPLPSLVPSPPHPRHHDLHDLDLRRRELTAALLPSPPQPPQPPQAQCSAPRPPSSPHEGVPPQATYGRSGGGGDADGGGAGGGGSGGGSGGGGGGGSSGCGGSGGGGTARRRRSSKTALAAAGWCDGMRSLLSARGRGMRAQACRHWAAWLCSGFGWTSLVFSATLSTSQAPPLGDGLPGCHFDYWEQLLIMAMELPGTLLVGMVVDAPRGPRGLCGGRRGVQVSAYALCAVCVLGAALLPRACALPCAMAARALGAAANSAMWIAAPELYPTHVSPRRAAPRRPTPCRPAPPRSPPPCCAAPRPRPHPLPAHARCGGWAPRSPHSSRCSAPCPPVRGSTPSSPHGAERPASASPLVSQPPSPPACAPQALLPAQQRSPPPNPSTRCKHAPPRLSMPASQPRPTVYRPLRVPHRRPETAGVALQGASPGRGIRRRPSTGMYGGPEQT